MSRLEATPASKEKPKYLVVFLHGLGSNGDDLISLVPYFADSLPDAHFYSPNGIEKCDMSPVGYQWFSLRDRNLDFMKSELERTSQLALDLIEQKLNELNLSYENLILIGFSQGTMMSLYLAHSQPNKMAAVVGFSGAFFPPEFPNNNGTPICLVHGMEDEVVSYQSMEHARERLEKIGVKTIETFGVKNLGHTIDLSGLKFAVDFINNHVRK